MSGWVLEFAGRQRHHHRVVARSSPSALSPSHPSRQAPVGGRCPMCAARLGAAVGSLTVAVDFAQEIKDLRKTMDSVREVTDLDKLQSQISDLEEQAGAPDLWDDPEPPRRSPARCQPRQRRARARHRAWTQRHRRPRGPRRAGPRRRATPTRWPRPSASWPRCRRPSASSRSAPCCNGEYDEREAVVTIRVGRRWRRRRGLRRDAACACTCAGPSATATRRRSWTRPTPRRPGSSRRPSRSTRPTRSAPSRSRPAPTAWCGSARSTTRAGARPASPRSRCIPLIEQTDSHRDPRERDQGRRLPLLAAPAASASTPPTPRCG